MADRLSYTVIALFVLDQDMNIDAQTLSRLLEVRGSQMWECLMRLEEKRFVEVIRDARGIRGRGHRSRYVAGPKIFDLVKVANELLQREQQIRDGVVA